MKRVLTFILIAILYLSYFGATVVKSNFFGNILSPIVTFIAAYYVFKGYYVEEKNKILKISGLFFTLSIFNWAVCDAIWAVEAMILKINPEQVNIVFNGYSLTSLLLLCSLIIRGYHQFKKWNGTQVVIDTATITICTMILVWVIFLNKDMQNAILMKSDWILMISVFVDFLIFIWVASWFLSIRKGKIPLYSRITAASCVVYIVFDIIYYYQYFYRLYEPNSLLDAAYVITFGMMAIGAIIKVKTQDKIKCVKFMNNGRNVKGLLLLAAPIILIIFKGMQLEYLVLMLLVITFYFIRSTYAQKNIYKEELLKNEKKLNLELEKKVEERTKKLNDLINKDVVTGLHSRRYFLQQLDNNINNLEKDENIILFYIGLNEYKMLKTMFGNYIVEKTLVEMGNRLKKYVHREEDILASYGEDVFVFAMKGSYTYADGLETGKSFIHACSDIYSIEEYDIRLTLNIGVSIYPLDAENRDELIKNADIAMLQARIVGFNKAMVFTKKAGELVFAKNEIEIMLKKADLDEEFQLYYQPQVSIEDESVVGFEALIRWKTKDGKFISPGEFIPIAEETGFIVPIGYWVMKKAIEQQSQWNKKTTQRIRMAINVSVRQLKDNNFITKLKGNMEENNVLPEEIEIEITETMQLEGDIKIKDTLLKIREMGISIAIDDFGTGYSSLYYLKQLPVDRVKIAKQLVDLIDKDIYDYAIVKAVITVAKVIGVSVIAEGVETKEQWECLKELQCDEIQGYYFAKPMSTEEIYKNWL
ncbi:bifunctional diguanylate cyclase/phosphodiesterase [Clostridium sp.]|uniref:putative bifunctional diguanylate cyclase/phosphodiesterase n=1 Tax=Clostridium sp. TaxID=1506 RepID=UPI003217BE2C